jgi:hypothetical protein
MQPELSAGYQHYVGNRPKKPPSAMLKKSHSIRTLIVVSHGM